MKNITFTLLFSLFLCCSLYGQLNVGGFQPHPRQVFHLEGGVGGVISEGRFGGAFSIEPQYTFANNISIGFEFNHKNFQLGDSNEPHKVNSFSPSFQVRSKERPFASYIGGRFGYYRIYDIDDTDPPSFGTIGAAFNCGIYAWVVNLGMEVSVYRPYGGAMFLYLKLQF
ncbi:hypothetical protein [Ekhidna sp.]|uniref:hypothetical protein n=1 Tax=Ekhidna sp. TaxID=2608089 RepID=UPI0032EC6029